MNYVDIIMIRHSYSIANNYVRKNRIRPTTPEFKNAKLDNKGIILAEILKNRINKYINKNIDSIDYVLTSPLKRAIQTTLILYNNKLNNQHILPIYNTISYRVWQFN